VHTWTYDHRIKWDEATILAINSHKFSHKTRESIEIEKHNTIDQEGKPQKIISLVLDVRALIGITSLRLK
jgi:hypothetical protein